MACTPGLLTFAVPIRTRDVALVLAAIIEYFNCYYDKYPENKQVLMVIWKTFRIFAAKIKTRGYEDISIWAETAELEVFQY